MSTNELPEELKGSAELLQEQIQGKELQDVEDVATDDYPDAAVENARMALRWKEETGNPNDCGTQVGWERANQLDNGEDLSEDTINRMVSFFSRHEATQEPDEPKTDCSRMMWKAWGGDEGFRWAESKQEEFTNAREASTGKEEWEHTMRELFDRVWAEDTDKELLEFSNSQVPEFVKTRLRETILSGDAVFSDIESLAGTDLMDFRTQLADGLTQDGWTLGDITGRIMDIDDGISREQAETVARTETAAAVNSAREQAYEETGMAEGEKFYWTGSLDNRTTEACRWLIQETNPNEGGTPVSLEKLRELIAEAPTHDPEMQDDLARPENYVVHPNERKTYTRDV